MPITPTVRIFENMSVPASGTNRSVDNQWTLDQLNDGSWQLLVRSLRPMTKVTVSLPRPLMTAAYVGHHLGMRINLTTMPAGWSFPSEYPGVLQAPVVAGYGNGVTQMIAAADDPIRKVKVVASSASVGIEWLPDPNNFDPMRPHVFRFWAEETASGSERDQICYLARRWRIWANPYRNAVRLAGHGLFGMMGMNADDPTQEFLEYATNYRKSLPGLILWGPMSDLGGPCCSCDQTVKGRYTDVLELSGSLGLGCYLYSRPQSIEGGPVDPAWWGSWVSDQSDCYYADTTGFRDMRGCYWRDDLVTEGASMQSANNPALVSNSVCGGGFRYQTPTVNGVLPLTLPTWEPEPRSTSPWFTSAPWFGTIMNHGRDLLTGGQNTDGYYDGTYDIPDGRRWTDHLWRTAFMLGHKICPGHFPPIVRQIIEARDAAGWDYGWEFIGLTADGKIGRFVKPDGSEVRANYDTVTVEHV